MAGLPGVDLSLLTRDETIDFYIDLHEEAKRKGTSMSVQRQLAQMDLFYLLTVILKRKDMGDHDWIYERCREVEKEPNGRLDLWSREHFKDLADNTPMLTHNRGWTTHGALRIGDQVYDDYGQPRAVLALSDRYQNSHCYRLTFSDGAEILAGAGHLWRVRLKHKLRVGDWREGKRQVSWDSEIVTTEALTTRADVGALQYPLFGIPQQLPIDPYVLGCWLGDGATSAARFVFSNEDAPHFVAEFERCGHTVRYFGNRKTVKQIALDSRDRSKVCTRGHLRTPDNVYRHGCRECRRQQQRLTLYGEPMEPIVAAGLSWRLRAMGLMRDGNKKNAGNTKHVPEQYMRSSIHQRFRLLQGLMDTDGHCNDRGTATFTNTNESLARGVYELATSLALRPRLRRYTHKTGDYAGNVFFQVSMQAHRDRNPFMMSRKAERAIQGGPHRNCRDVVSVEPIETVPTRCIQVDGGIYLAGAALVPTHNSSIITYGLTIKDILNNPNLTVGIFSFNRPTAKAFLRQIKQDFESNELLRAMFPDILWANPWRDAPKWSEDDGIVVRRTGNPKESTIEAWGLVDGQPTALDVNTPILTTVGWKRHGDLQVGDFVYGGDGYPVRVVFNTGIMLDRPCSKVVFSDTEIVAADDHLWPVDRVVHPRSQETRKQDSGWTITEREIVRTIDLPLSVGPARDPRRRLLKTPILQMDSGEMPLAPYILGLWLGDGSSDGGIITTQDEEIVQQISAHGFTVEVAQDRITYKMYRLLELRPILKNMGLLRNKHIPSPYLLANSDDRLALLQGLMDSDGHCHSAGWGQCIFSNTNRAIIEGAHFLAASLGFRPGRIRENAPIDSEKHNMRYVFSFVGTHTEPPFRLTRKLNRCVEKRRNTGRYVRQITSIISRPVNCIQIAAEDGIYLAGHSLVPTHNSKHFGLMVYDDVVTADSVGSPEMIEKVTRAWEVSRNLTMEGGATRYIGTRWHYADTYRTILERKAAIPRIHPVTYEGTVDGTPVLWTKERVAEKRREMGPYSFSSQLLLDPTADRKQGFREEWIRYYQGGSFVGMNKYLLVDPANSKNKSSDYTAMAVIGLGDDENYYVLDMVRDRLSLPERGDALFALHRRWKPKTVGYEKYGMSADIDYLKDRMARENYRFEITDVGGQVPKAERIRRLIPLFEDGRWHLPETLFKVDYEGKHVDLVRSFLDEEYRAFPVGLHDDMFDAMARIWDLQTVWPKATARAQVQDRYARSSRIAKPGSAWAA